MASRTQVEVDAPERLVTEWIEQRVGPVQRLERQGRWRPGWYADALRDGELVRLYVRGSRGGYWPPQPLSYEAKVHEHFGEQGLRVPTFLGFIEEVPALVMEIVPGRADLSTAPEADREAVRQQLAEQMARIHAMDPEALHGFGAPRAEDDAQLARGYLDRVEAIYRATKQRPEPAVEFVLGWLHRNLPTTPCPPTVVHVDAGQFMFEGTELTAMIDFELMDVGDRWVDLGALRTRNRAEPIGDLNSFYRTYAAAAGVELDLARIRYHGIGVSLLCPMMVAGSLAAPTAEVPYFEYLTWMAFSLKDALEQLAEVKGLELDRYEQPTAGHETRFTPMFTALEQAVGQTPALDDHSTYIKTNQGLIARALGRIDRSQPELDRRYVEEAALVTRQTAAGWAEADAQLEELVLREGEAHEDELIRLFHRRMVGMSLLLADREDWSNKHAWLTEPTATVQATG